MSVTQFFNVEVRDADNGDTYKLTREEVEELYADLGEALGVTERASDVGLADDLGYIRGMIDQVAEALGQFVSAITGEAPTHTESVADIERRLAAEQATAQPAARRSSGSGIGNAHV